MCWAGRAFRASKAFVCHAWRGGAGARRVPWRASLGAGGAGQSKQAVTMTGLHIDVTRSLRVSVLRDARGRARVPSGSQVHLRTCMPMPARAGAQAAAGAPVRVLAYKGARLSLPLSASPCICLSSLTRPQSYMDSPRATPTGRGGGQPPRPDPEPPRPAARAPRDKNASSVLTDLRRQPRGMPPRAPSGRLPRPATSMTHECPACPACPAWPAHDAPTSPPPPGP